MLLSAQSNPMKRPVPQLSLVLPPRRAWGGRRPGAGRKLTPGRRPGVPHRPRPAHHATHPLHVTLRTVSSICCLRADRVFPAVRHALTAASSEGFRVIHFSVQNDHLHLLVEAETRTPCPKACGASPSASRAPSTVLSDA